MSEYLRSCFQNQNRVESGHFDMGAISINEILNRKAHLKKTNMSPSGWGPSPNSALFELSWSVYATYLVAIWVEEITQIH